MAECSAALEIWAGRLVRRMQKTHVDYSKSIVVEDRRDPLNRVTSECTGYPLRRETRRRLNSLQNGWLPMFNKLNRNNVG